MKLLKELMESKQPQDPLVITNVFDKDLSHASNFVALIVTDIKASITTEQLSKLITIIYPEIRVEDLELVLSRHIKDVNKMNNFYGYFYNDEHSSIIECNSHTLQHKLSFPEFLLSTGVISSFDQYDYFYGNATDFE